MPVQALIGIEGECCFSALIGVECSEKAIALLLILEIERVHLLRAHVPR